MCDGSWLKEAEIKTMFQSRALEWTSPRRSSWTALSNRGAVSGWFCSYGLVCLFGATEHPELFWVLCGPRTCPFFMDASMFYCATCR